MGGSPGDGLQDSWATGQQPQQSSNNMRQHDTNSRPAGYSPGSITQFAPQAMPTMAQQNFYNSDGMMSDQQEQGGASYSGGSAIPGQQVTATSTGSYAARSAHAYASTGASFVPQQVTLPSPPPSSASTMPLPSVATVSDLSSVIPAQQDRILTDCTRRVQEHAYYMRQAMEMDDLSTVLDRAAYMVGELGGAHGQTVGSGDSHLLTPKNYYELHIRALEEMPNLEEYFINKGQQQQPTTNSYTMLQLYEFVQFCPQVLSRLYLQICAGSALIRSKEVGAKWVLNDIAAVTRSVQNPTRGLFLRHFLLQAFRDKLPDQLLTDSAAVTAATVEPMMEAGTVQDAYEFVLSNFVEMNKLWVRLQHLPGEGKSKEQRKRRERERNDLRVLVGMNLVRLSQLEGVTSRVYGEIILPEVLGQIVACGDPLAQAYLMDCIIQVFPDEYHIETLPILLNVCPKLRDKVNIRTILQSLMDRLSDYYAEEELLDENDSNQVKKSLSRDSLPLFEECVQNVYNARGPKLTCKEVIRLQTALLNFSLKSCPGNMDQFDHCLQVCASSLRQAVMSYNLPEGTVVNLPTDANQIVMDEASAAELDKLLAVVIDKLALKVLDLQHFSVLMTFLPWQNRKILAVTMLRAVVQSSVGFQGVREVNELFNVISPIFEHSFGPTRVAGIGPMQDYQDFQRKSGLESGVDGILLARLVHLLNHEDTSVSYDMLLVAKSRLASGQHHITNRSLVALVFSALRLVDNLCAEEKTNTPDQDQEKKEQQPHLEGESETKSEDASPPSQPSEDVNEGEIVTTTIATGSEEHAERLETLGNGETTEKADSVADPIETEADTSDLVPSTREHTAQTSLRYV
jgi:vacuolar protein sorting-associated protein 35